MTEKGQGITNLIEIGDREKDRGISVERRREGRDRA